MGLPERQLTRARLGVRVMTLEAMMRLSRERRATGALTGTDVRARTGPDRVTVTIADSGQDIRPDLLSSIFDSFVQGTRGLDRAEGRLGLGLAIVRSLVHLHGGTVRVESEGPGRGSRVTVQSPLGDDPVESRRTPAQTTPGG